MSRYLTCQLSLFFRTVLASDQAVFKHLIFIKAQKKSLPKQIQLPKATTSQIWIFSISSFSKEKSFHLQKNLTIQVLQPLNHFSRPIKKSNTKILTHCFHRHGKNRWADVQVRQRKRPQPSEPRSGNIPVDFLSHPTRPGNVAPIFVE